MKEAMKYAVAIAITAAAMLAYMYEAPPEGGCKKRLNHPPTCQLSTLSTV